ncbi:MAG: enoyl-CoA hydratase/isomerase family protein [Phycisphaerales bacterium]|nr:MAG: enoyl-CoA hydratase/isomerase family protein [Phycisphaerales bacterium]
MIRFTLDEHAVGRIALDRADKRNALTPGMLREIGAHAASATQRGARAILLEGEGGVFCAGFDLTLCRDDATGGAMRDLLAELSRAARALRRAPVPVVGAAQGGAIAGGCALLGGCDVVVTDAKASLGYPVLRLGVSPALTSPLLRLAMHDGGARQRLLDTNLIDGREALRTGLAHECVDRPEDVRPRAHEIARALAAKPPHALRATKAWLNELDGSDNDDVFDRALHVSLSLAGGDEERELLAAMWGKKA